MKKLKRLLCAVMAAVTALSVSVTANANGNSGSASSADTNEAIGSTDSEGYVLVSEEKYVDGDFLVVDRHYIYPSVVAYAGTTKEENHKESRTIYDKNGVPGDNSSGTKVVTMWVSGTFKWNKDEDTATVSNVKAGFDDYSDSSLKITAVEGYPKSGSNQGATVLGGFFGKKYAYIEYCINIKVVAKQSNHQFKLWYDIDIDGDPHTKH